MASIRPLTFPSRRALRGQQLGTFSTLQDEDKRPASQSARFSMNILPLSFQLTDSAQEPACGCRLMITRDSLPALKALPPWLGLCRKSYMWKGTGFHPAIGDACLSKETGELAASVGKEEEAPQRSHYPRMWFEFHSSLPATPSAPFIKGTKLKTQDVIATWAHMGSVSKIVRG